MVNKPLIRPAISGGGTWPWGGLVDDPFSKVQVLVYHEVHAGNSPRSPVHGFASTGTRAGQKKFGGTPWFLLGRMFLV